MFKKDNCTHVSGEIFDKTSDNVLLLLRHISTVASKVPATIYIVLIVLTILVSNFPFIITTIVVVINNIIFAFNLVLDLKGV